MLVCGWPLSGLMPGLPEMKYGHAGPPAAAASSICQDLQLVKEGFADAVTF